VRTVLAILLLLTAAVHPLVHFGDVLNDCPCLHGAVAEVIRPEVVPAAIGLASYARLEIRSIAADIRFDVPARAPPVA
jgi:hypothetical protein